MIYITGDTHGDIDYPKLLKLKEKNLSYDDYLIICGDAGICWSIYDSRRFLSLYNDIGCTILFIDGNHENFDMLNGLPLVEYKGALMHQVDEHIFHILRGEILTLEGKTFFCLGGACSIDKMYRTPHISWWPEEEINKHDIDNAIANLEKVNNKVDYVITHCVDTKTVMKYFYFKRDVCTDQLMFIDKVVDYKHWFFGHYHFDRKISDKKTCLYQDIIEIKE
jgi:DNA repair exonuclease SbcCD nuclease subunit